MMWGRKRHWSWTTTIELLQLNWEAISELTDEGLDAGLVGEEPEPAPAAPRYRGGPGI